jgi:hypothetical protein
VEKVGGRQPRGNPRRHRPHLATTEGRLAAVPIIPSSWGSQWGVTYTPSMPQHTPLVYPRDTFSVNPFKVEMVDAIKVASRCSEYM